MLITDGFRNVRETREYWVAREPMSSGPTDPQGLLGTTRLG